MPQKFFLRNLAIASAFGALSVSAVAFAAHHQASAPQKNQVAGFQRVAVGEVTVTALYDGYLHIDNALLKGMSDEEKHAHFEQAFLDDSNGVQTAVNAYLLQDGKQLILVDTGAAKVFGPTLGALADNLRAAGYAPKEVNIVLLTHLHPDHVSGLLTQNGERVFPHATIYASKTEADYWLSETELAKAPEDAKPKFVLSQKALAPYQASGQFKTFTPGDQLATGLTVVDASGHTPGHTAYLLHSGDEELLIWGDIVHSHSIQFAHPEVSIEFDSDQKAAIATRYRVFADAAERRILVAGMHLPFPGLGHVRKEDDGYRWIPLEYGPVK